MIEVTAAAAVISAVADSVGLVDKIYGAWRKFTDNRAAEESKETEYYEQITSGKNNKELVHFVNGQARQTVTIDELKAKLSTSDVRHIEALEQRLEINVRTWDGIVGNIELETNLPNKTKYEIQLDKLKDKIGKDLSDILSFVEMLGFSLGDHYSAAKHIAQQQ